MQASVLLQRMLIAGFLASPGLTQNYEFQIDSAASAFTWTGTSSLGDITELPPTFNLSGSAVMRMVGAGNPVGNGSFVTGGSAAVSPDLHGEIPNPTPTQPPLATLDFTGLQMEVVSPAFNVSRLGNFDTTIAVNVLAGTRTVTPLGGQPMVLDLTGESAGPSPSSGSLTWTGSQYLVQLTVNTNFPFFEQSTGLSGNVAINGVLVARYTPEAPAVFCTSLPNSSGFTAGMSFSGQPSLGAGAPTVHVDQLPFNTFGILFYGPNQIDLPFGDGRRCVGGTLVRFAPVSTGPTGQVTQLIDNSALPKALAAGDQRNFQFWFRDVPAGGTGFNTSDALGVFYTP